MESIKPVCSQCKNEFVLKKRLDLLAVLKFPVYLILLSLVLNFFATHLETGFTQKELEGYLFYPILILHRILTHFFFDLYGIASLVISFIFLLFLFKRKARKNKSLCDSCFKKQKDKAKAIKWFFVLFLSFTILMYHLLPSIYFFFVYKGLISPCPALYYPDEFGPMNFFNLFYGLFSTLLSLYLTLWVYWLKDKTTQILLTLGILFSGVNLFLILYAPGDIFITSPRENMPNTGHSRYDYPVKISSREDFIRFLLKHQGEENVFDKNKDQLIPITIKNDEVINVDYQFIDSMTKEFEIKSLIGLHYKTVYQFVFQGIESMTLSMSDQGEVDIICSAGA